MRASDARDIPISSYLSCEGYSPARERHGGRELWYSSPLRSGDSSPSFKVDTVLNVWYDHGLAHGGTLIDLVCELKSVTVAEALAIIEATGLGAQAHRPIDAPRLFETTGLGRTSVPPQNGAAGEKEKKHKAGAGDSHLLIHKVCDPSHPALLDYLRSRGIDETVGHQHLRQVHFGPQYGTGRFFALGFPCGQGFDARSKFFKGFIGTGKDITVVPGAGQAEKGRSVAVFESFVDYLSLVTLQQMSTDKPPTALKEDAIILHSAALKRRATAALKAGEYQSVSLYLDHDDAGRMVTEFFVSEMGRDNTVDASDLYSGYKDLNERLVANRTQGRS